MIQRIYSEFSQEDYYKKYLLHLRWGKHVTCPFCKSIKSTNLGSNFRFHCNLCNSNYSLTVNTIMHDTKIDLRKWLITLHLYLNNDNLSYRKLSNIIDVNKNTANRMIKELCFLFSKKRLTIIKIAGLNKDAVEIMSLMLLIDMGRRN